MAVEHDRHANNCKAAQDNPFVTVWDTGVETEHLRLVRKLSAEMDVSPLQNKAAHCYAPLQVLLPSSILL